MQISLHSKNNSHHEFVANKNIPILWAGLAKGLMLPYECATGTCGTCRAHLLNGLIQDGWKDAPGKSVLKEGSNEFLMCQCVAASDCKIEIHSEIKSFSNGYPKPFEAKGKITSVKNLACDIALLEIRTDRTFNFLAGQFILISVPGIEGARAYSMLNYQENTSKLSFVVKKKEGGNMSEWLFSDKPHTADISLFGPLGRATFDPYIQKNIICMAGGSGIGQTISILECASNADHFKNNKGYVFFGIRDLKNAFLLEKLLQYKKKHGGNLEITIAISDDNKLPMKIEHSGLNFTLGFVHEVATKAMEGKFDNNITAYVSGPPPMVDATIRMLILQARLQASFIRYDKFS